MQMRLRLVPLKIYDLIDLDLVVRSRNADKLSSCDFVCDVGGVFDVDSKKFDHHHAGAPGGISSAGMVLRYLYNKGFCSLSEFDFLKNSFVDGVDAIDIGAMSEPLGFCSISNIISSFNCPSGTDTADQDKFFLEAVGFVIGFVGRILDRNRCVQSYLSVVQSEMNKLQKVLWFDEQLPWIECFFQLSGESHPALFVVTPCSEGWKIQVVPKSISNRFFSRINMPKSWGGLSNKELERVSGIEGAVFCHKGLFLSVWKSKVATEKVLYKLLGVCRD